VVGVIAVMVCWSYLFEGSVVSDIAVMVCWS